MPGRVVRHFLLCSTLASALSPQPTLPLRSPSPPRRSRWPVVQASELNGVSERFPWRFDGRLWFRPAFVRAPDPTALPAGVRVLSLFGWTLGGNVCLEYDESPVGPYVEYVTMGALVSKRGAVGQWGSRLFVSTDPAEEVCRRVWDVPAEVARISFEETGDSLQVDAPPALASLDGAPETIRVSGWATTRSSHGEDANRVGGVPVLWTPSIKALWAPLVPLPADGEGLPLHDLRLSASSLRLQVCAQSPSDLLGVPLPVGLSVDGLRIEIASAGDQPL